MIQSERIKYLNNKPVLPGEYVLYWLQASQREHYNHALEYAIERANRLDKPLVVFFGLTGDYPEANLRHYSFMLRGLSETAQALEQRKIKFVLRICSPEKGAIDIAKRSCLVIVDGGYTRIQRQWRNFISKNLGCQVVEIESDTVVPSETASNKEEYSAATIRPKILMHLDDFMIPVTKNRIRRSSLDMRFKSEIFNDINSILSKLRIDRSVSPSSAFKGGTQEARKILKNFIKIRLESYADKRNDPNSNVLSNMSPYLHFGQISPLYIALEINQVKNISAIAYLEELIVRRELAINLIFHNKKYDSFACLPIWCQKTLKAHAKDKRQFLYSREKYEYAQTHDPYWNAAQLEMVKTGKMHGYMRMYWGKKIIEWTKDPVEAFETALYLNNKYEIDGRDPNGFAGVAWCFGKHDRPWAERPIFGMIRYMNAAGLKRKFDIDQYSKRFI